MIGIVPSHFKISSFQKGNKTDITNYRPLKYNLQFCQYFCKMSENRLINYFTSVNALNKNQFGFIRVISTNDEMYKHYK